MNKQLKGKAENLSIKLWILLVFLIVLLLIFYNSFQNKNSISIPEKGIPLPRVELTKTNLPEATQELKKFSSVQEIRDYLKNSALNNVYGSGEGVDSGVRRIDMAMAVPTESMSMDQSAKTSVSINGGGGASDYSKTNIQVEGVDEADFVKNDGKYIYTITQNNLVIVDAFPAEKAKIVFEGDISSIQYQDEKMVVKKGKKAYRNYQIRDMFVNKDRLVIFSQDYDNIYSIQQYDYLPRQRSALRTHALVYDISDRSNPRLVKDYSASGDYYQSRMIKEQVYFISQEQVYYYNDIIYVPEIKSGSSIISKPEIYYFDNPEDSYTFTTITSFNIFGEDNSVNAKSFMLGYSNNLYVSENNIYITYQKNPPYRYYQTHNQERFFSVVVPLIPFSFHVRVNAIKSDNSINSYEKWDTISSILEEMYNTMSEKDKQELVKKIQNAIDEYEIRLEQERRKTVIHKIGINNGDISYSSRGEVSGYLLNQFSMDEHEDYFRVATTTNLYVGKNVMYNNVYVLDKNLNTVGKIEGIAPDERIYSTRFIGERLYMVTFKRIDPLFVIDLKNPANPKILGELKIPGFSDYLHPYDDTHIIGIGKETDSNQWGGVSIKGLKLALFDVSDVSSPKQIDKYEIGESGTDSEALREHKAFLFDRKKNVLVIPVSEVKGEKYYNPKFRYEMQRRWQGAYVFGLSPVSGFELKGRITHNEGDENYYDYYSSNYAVRRSMYMDDVLYTVSASKIKMNSIDNIENEINSVELPYVDSRYPYPVPMIE